MEVEHLRAAIAVWDYCEASAAYIWGGMVGDPLTDRILEAIQGAGEAGLSRTAIREVVGGKTPAEQIDAALGYLDVRGLAHERVVTTPGRYAHAWYPGAWSEVPEPVEERVEPDPFAPPSQAHSSTLRGCASHPDEPNPSCRYCKAQGATS